MNTATAQDILTEMCNQLDLNVTTTAHDVKVALRANGFTTTQADVSDTMKEAANGLKLNNGTDVSTEYNGKYLTYSYTDKKD